jgi:hypothetical protein
MNNRGSLVVIGAVIFFVLFLIAIPLWGNAEVSSYYIDGAVVSIDHNTSYYSRSTTIILDNGKVLIKYDTLVIDIIIGMKYRFHMGINNIDYHYVKSYTPITSE